MRDIIDADLDLSSDSEPETTQEVLDALRDLEVYQEILAVVMGSFFHE